MPLFGKITKALEKAKKDAEAAREQRRRDNMSPQQLEMEARINNSRVDKKNAAKKR